MTNEQLFEVLSILSPKRDGKVTMGGLQSVTEMQILLAALEKLKTEQKNSADAAVLGAARAVIIEMGKQLSAIGMKLTELGLQQAGVPAQPVLYA